MNSLIAETVESPFARLRELLNGIEPGADPIDMTIGEPRHPMPEMVGRVLGEHTKLYGKYPPIRGIDELRNAISSWHDRRYDLAGAVDPERHILPLVGSREGLFSALFPIVERKLIKGQTPVVLIPNPFYQVYAAGTVASGAEPVFLDAKAENNFLPDLDGLVQDEELLQRTVALYLCSPSNPEGSVADRAYLEKAIMLARAYGFMIFSDECYSEIYDVDAPDGILKTSFDRYGDFKQIIAFNSLSKRSNVPGLRSGFCAGDENFIEKFTKFRNVACPQMPLPHQHVSAALWKDEAHVMDNRALYRAKFDAANEIIGGKYGYQRPGGAFFLWLNMKHFSGGEDATVTLWKGCGVKVLPGAYLASECLNAPNPAQDYVRLALVDDLDTTKEALGRVVQVLS